MSQPAKAPGPNGRTKTNPPPARPAASPTPNYGTQPKVPSPQGGAPDVGLFTSSGNGTAPKKGHPAQAYGGIGSPPGHRAWALGIATHELAGAAGVREADAMLRREIRRADNLTSAQKAKAMWRLRRAHRRLAGTLEAGARAAATVAKVRAEVNAEILAAKRKKRAGGFTVA